MYDLFSDLFDGFDWFMQPTTYKEEKKCPVCGRTYSDFRRDGKLGCSECYKVFRGPVTETLRQIIRVPFMSVRYRQSQAKNLN